MMNNCLQGGVAACLVTSHFWGEALAAVSTGAQFVATVTGAVIGCVTLYRMYRKGIS